MLLVIHRVKLEEGHVLPQFTLKCGAATTHSEDAIEALYFSLLFLDVVHSVLFVPVAPRVFQGARSVELRNVD